MKLSNDLVRQTLAWLRASQIQTRFKAGAICIRVGDRSSVSIAPAMRITPLSDAKRKVNTVSFRCLSSSGVTFSDGSYWLDGEQFLMQLPPGPDKRYRAVLCGVSHWEPLSAGVFRVSAQFIRMIQLPGDAFLLPRRRPLPHVK